MNIGGIISPREFIKKYPLWTIFLLALILRLPFLDGSIDFFDSPQYMWRSAVPNLLEALSSGHAPYHPGYVFFTWLLHQFGGGGADVNPTLLALPSVLASAASLVLVYLIGTRLFSRPVAWLATGLVALAPFFWISSITILVDPVMIAFYLLSVWLYLEWLERTHRGKWTSHWIWLIASGCAFGWSLFSHTQIVFWVLAFPALIVITRKPRKWLITLWRSVPWVIGPLLAIAAYVGLLLYAGHNETVLGALQYLLGGNAGDRVPLSLVPAARNLTLVGGSVLAIAALAASVRMIVQQPRRGWGYALWLWPGLVASSLYIYSNLAGRASMLALLPAALLAANWLILDRKYKLLSQKQVLMWVVLLSTLAAAAPLVGSYVTSPAQMEAINEVRKTLKPGGVYVSSNEAKTLHDYATFDVVFEMDKDTITNDIDQALQRNAPVYVGSDALVYPYYAVDGNNWRIFSISGVEQYRQHGSLSAYLFNRYELDLAEQVDTFPLAVSRIRGATTRSIQDRYVSSLRAMRAGHSAVLGTVVDADTNKPISHVQVNAYGTDVVHPLRFDHYDWPTQLAIQFEVSRGARTKDPLYWSYTDRSGLVSFPLPTPSSSRSDTARVDEYAFVTHTLATGATQTIPPLFVDPTVEIVASGSETFTGSAEAVATQLAAHKSVLAELVRNVDDSYTATITPVEYTLRGSDTIKAGELSGHVSDILPDGSRKAQPGQKGNVTFGPWKDLAPGQYVATWRLRRTTAGQDRVLRLDVGYNFGEGTIFEQVVGAGDLPVGELEEISVPFTVEPHMKLLEFRTLALAGPGFVVDSISIKPRK